MKSTLFFIPIISIIIYSCSVKEKANYSKIFLDDKYDQIRKVNDTSTPENYQITSLKGFILDCSRYDFSFVKHLNNGNEPDKVFINSRSGSFTIKLNVKGETIIDSSSMTGSFPGTGRFTGFIKGERVYLGIGTQRISNEQTELACFWSAEIEIK